MDDLDFYRRQSPTTDPGGPAFDGLPPDVATLTQVIGGLVVHRDLTAAFGFDLPPARRSEADTRDVAAILAHLGGLDPKPPSERLAGTCRDFAVLLVSMLRAQGRPARARVGFAGYFAEGWFDDHWVAEVWDDDGWRLIDAQVASADPGTYTKLEVDPLDVPRDGFLVGGQAWQECRAGHRDPATLGVHSAGLSGMWEVQGNVIRDLAALNAVETLPWDNWGLIPIHYDQLPPADVALLDELAAVSAAGGPLSTAREVYLSDPRIRRS
ncbi:transglutaminase-like domain-containing protein [Actinoplanes sp. NPDC051470]|uniref:transglutaminase-like domain-containing protein n=1 Tax=unclassified Actinoplanes TaxID=2626549 RepID=UPI0034403944